ncbi:MAG: 50S ribosomal protein L9 [Treponema sp.]|jgi:large subunit ribosomal protein L9|nr:50S ribosomal protein L9 [Treponema sp.]
MKVILNKDLNPLGEEGDVKDVAKGYARNYLFPRGIALPYTERTVKLFEARREEIEARKAVKRQDAAGFKEKLESLELNITMPAGANGRLYGAVTNQTVADELAKAGFQIERKRIELPGNSFKSVGKYKVTVKLYESAAAELTIAVQAQVIKTEERVSPARKERRPRDVPSTAAAAAGEAPAASGEAPSVEAPAGPAAPEAVSPGGKAVPADTAQETSSTETAAAE